MKYAVSGLTEPPDRATTADRSASASRPFLYRQYVSTP